MTDSTRKIAQWVWHCTSLVRTRICVAGMLGILRIGVGLAFVWVSKLLVDQATSPHATDHSLVRLSVLLGALLVAEMLLMLTVSYLNNQTEVRLKNHLRSMLYQRLMRVRHDHLSDTHSADYVGRLNEDTRVLADAVTRKLPDSVVLMAQFAGAFVMLFCLSRTLALSIVAILPLFILLSKVYVTRTRRITAQVRNTDSAILTSIQEGLQHHAVVQTLECEEAMDQRLDHHQNRLYGWTMDRTRVGIFSRAMMRSGFIACYLTAFLWSIWHLHSGAITYGTMTAFLQLVARIQNPMSGLSQLLPSLAQAITSVDRLYALHLMPVDNKEACVSLQAPAGVRLEHVSFGYTEASPLIFNDFSYDFTPGSRTVIMGETGVGKTTLIRMLLALLYPAKGKICIYNGQTEHEVDPHTRCNMVYVPQGNSLFAGTVRDNLLLASPSASDKDIDEALHIAVADFVHTLPNGLDTHCGELGTALSEGQAQRIAIARALLRHGSVLILDEFNSALDTDTASTLIRRLTEARPHSTIIFISHRKDVAQYCHQVLRLD